MKRTPVRSLAAIGCAVVLTATVAGCGSSAPARLTASAYKTKANAICTAANKDLSAALSTLSQQSTEAEVSAALSKAADRVIKEIGDLKKLLEPTSLTKGASAFYAADLKATASIKAEGINLVKSGINPFVDADAKAKALGITKCASSSA